MQRMSGLAAICGFSAFLLLLTAFHFVQPELDPLTRFGSEYAAGRYGWLMNAAFFAFAAGLVFLAIGFGLSLASALTGIAAVGIFLSGIFNADLQGGARTQSGLYHDLSGFLAFLTLLPAMILHSRRLGKADLLHGRYKLLPMLAWVTVVLFLAMLFAFGPAGRVGLGQRIFLVAMFAWLLTASTGLLSGALTAPATPSR